MTLGADEPAPGVVILSPLGEVLSVHAGAPSPSTFVSALASHANGGLLVLGQHGQFEESQAFLARFAADGAALGEVQLGMDMRMSTMAPVGDAALTVGSGTCADPTPDAAVVLTDVSARRVACRAGPCQS